MTRTELISKAKELNIETTRPVHMMKTSELQEIVNTHLQGAEVQAITLKSRILDLHKEGNSRKEMQAILEQEGWGGKVRCGKVRPVYIHYVLKNSL